MKTVAVILAAGQSTRMGFSKQLALLGDRPVLLHTLLRFEETRKIDGIILVARPDDRIAFETMCKQYHIDKLITVCDGGATRQQSAENSLAVLPPDTDLIAIHDGARPLVTAGLIERVVDVAAVSGAAAAAIPLKDTVKEVDAENLVVRTPDRNLLRAVQTPQVFLLSKYQQALATAKQQKWDFTDDCQLFERCGLPVTLVAGDEKNIKITTPTDLILAAAIQSV